MRTCLSSLSSSETTLKLIIIFLLNLYHIYILLSYVKKGRSIISLLTALDRGRVWKKKGNFPFFAFPNSCQRWLCRRITSHHHKNTPQPAASSRCKLNSPPHQSDCNGIYKRQDPLAVGFCFDGASRRTNGQIPRALLWLWVHLQKMEGPNQMLWLATLWEEGVPLKQLPYFLDNEHARTKNT